MGQTLSIPYELWSTTTTFWGGLYHYVWGKGRTQPYSAIPKFLQVKPEDSDKQRFWKQNARVHLYSLASAFYLYRKPHYRKGAYRDDLLDNLRNVAIPGTGIPLSWFVGTKLTAFNLVAFVNPVVSFIAALHYSFKTGESLVEEYKTRLLAPNDWFTYWRTNCNVVGLHSFLFKNPPGYDMENKWTFLEEGEKRSVPVSPYLKTSGIVVKHRNEEGGLGIYFYKNATAGGDWIIQERIQNSEWVSSLLPKNAPLSTFRVITQSKASVKLGTDPVIQDIAALSCVFRAGRENADTDHSSILFDVDTKTGTIRGGTTNAHWYRLGLWQWMKCPWRSWEHSYSHHPDGDIPVSGNVVPDIDQFLELVRFSHLNMCPDVPFCGWDVVLSADPKVPVCLLEVNLSCNFFRGTFDKKVYLDFLDEAFEVLQAKRMVEDAK